KNNIQIFIPPETNGLLPTKPSPTTLHCSNHSLASLSPIILHSSLLQSQFLNHEMGVTQSFLLHDSSSIFGSWHLSTTFILIKSSYPFHEFPALKPEQSKPI
ncbi:hypothetical protein V8G54_004297, partial [Vigna mungo]